MYTLNNENEPKTESSMSYKTFIKSFIALALSIALILSSMIAVIYYYNSKTQSYSYSVSFSYFKQEFDKQSWKPIKDAYRGLEDRNSHSSIYKNRVIIDGNGIVMNNVFDYAIMKVYVYLYEVRLR